jgi:hypothetical protein
MAHNAPFTPIVADAVRLHGSVCVCPFSPLPHAGNHAGFGPVFPGGSSAFSFPNFLISAFLFLNFCFLLSAFCFLFL